MEESPVVFVVDANFFISGAIVKTPPIVYSTNDAISEVKDTKARETLARFELSHQIIMKEPSEKSVEIVKETATDSGNIVLLSPTDVRLIAVALDFMPEEEPEEEEKAASNAVFDQWITPKSYGVVKEEKGVILITSDSTMQCVCLILGIKVVSSSGQRVSEVKRWLMRCSACLAETLDASKEFCPECGHHTLVRYALVMREGVETELPLPRRFEPSSKGKRFSIPKHVGGRHGKKDLILSEDMLMEANRKFRWSGGSRNSDPTTEGHTFFEPRGVPRQAPQYSTGKKNPNSAHHLLGKKKKRNRPN